MLNLMDSSKICSCGKKHSVAVKNIVIGKNAIERLPEELKKLDINKVFVLSDKNTYTAAGERVISVLENNKFEYSQYSFNSDRLEPDEFAVGSAVMHYDNSCDAIVAVGSGVINDIGKILAATANKPYIIVGTVPSMDGYASATSSMSMDGLKVSLNSKCPDIIIGDTDVLKNAPLHMLKSGLGDMLAKYVSICEWRIAKIITGEYYCEEIANLVRMALKRCVDNAEGLLKREEAAVEAVFEGLIIGGAAMSYAGLSRPASGVEHYISHIWDMRGLDYGTKVDLHGIQCAIGTLMTVKLYEQIKKITPDRKKAEEYVQSFDFSKWSEELRSFLGKGAEAMIAQEAKEGKYDLTKHEKRLDIIINSWDKIIEIINQELPDEKTLEKLFDVIDLPKTCDGIGIEKEILPMTFKASKDIRDKYVLSRLAWDLGIIDELKY